MRRVMLASAAGLVLAGCATAGVEDVSDSAGRTVGAGVPVLAAAETPPVGTAARDAADDPAIWVDPRDRTRGVILGTDKQAGLYVYDLAGRQRQYLAGGRPNNVDLRDAFPTPKTLLTVDDDFGGWAEANSKYFDEKNGIVTKQIAASGKS